MHQLDIGIRRDRLRQESFERGRDGPLHGTVDLLHLLRRQLLFKMLQNQRERTCNELPPVRVEASPHSGIDFVRRSAERSEELRSLEARILCKTPVHLIHRIRIGIPVTRREDSPGRIADRRPGPLRGLNERAVIDFTVGCKLHVQHAINYLDGGFGILPFISQQQAQGVVGAFSCRMTPLALHLFVDHISFPVKMGVHFLHRLSD
ncbi:hypothetical protein D3C71_1406530 [compost metagenome]